MTSDDRYDQAWILSRARACCNGSTGDYRAAAASHQQALETLCDLGEPAAQGFTRNELGLVQQLTGDYQAAAASHRQALRLLCDAGEPYGQACVLNSLGELASRTSATGQARDHHGQALAIARDIGAPLRKHAPWKESAKATSKTATPARPPPICGTHWPSTSASEAPPPSASRKPCANTGQTQPHLNPPTTRSNSPTLSRSRG